MNPLRILTLTLLLPGFAAAAGRPNILFIAIDDLRPELGCYGSPQARTPHLDRFASQATRFDRAYCQVPICGASRASLMTGILPTPERFVGASGTYAEKDAPGVSTLPEVFRKAGYTTVSNGKIFHHKEDTEQRSWSEPAWKPGLSHMESHDPETTRRLSKGKQRGRIYEAPEVPDDAYPDGLVAKRTIEDLRRLKRTGKPFFLACGFIRPHMPFYAPRRYWDLYQRDQIEIAENRHRPKDAPKALRGSGEFRSYHPADFEVGSEAWHRMMRHGYLASTSYVDKLTGDILAELDRLELARDTIVVVWGDHGWHLGEHDFWGKHNTMHLATRVPLILHVPGSTPADTKALVETIDLFPTLCELAGLEVPDTVQGRSFAKLLDAPEDGFREVAYSRYGPGDAVITERFSYTRYRDGSEMLYDLQEDPDENVNVATDPGHVGSMRKMRSLLKQRQAEAAAAKVGKDNARAEPVPANQAKPNVLMIAIDDLNDWVGCLEGHPDARTPNIDRLAHRGILFTNAHCQAAICNPSRTSLMYALRPSTSGIYDNQPVPWTVEEMRRRVTLPRFFAAHGYRTLTTGKIYHASGLPPGDFGVVGPRPGQRNNFDERVIPPTPEGARGLWDFGPQGYEETKFQDHADASWAIEQLKQKQARPFFMTVGLYRPHVPLYAPTRIFDTMPLEGIDLPPVLENDRDDLPPVAAKVIHSPYSPDHSWFVESGNWRKAVQAYLACIRFSDEQVGRLLDALEASPHADNTIVVLYSDHGFFLGEKKHWAKRALWERATRVPFIISAPGHSPGTCRRPVELLSLYPTLAELCGLPEPDGIDGVSVVPLLRDPQAEWSRPALTTEGRNNHAVRSERYRYIRYHDGSEELYDHETDPNEWTNLASRREHAALKKELAAWFPQVNAPPARAGQR